MDTAPRSLRIALVQPEIRLGDVEHNLGHLSALVGRGREAGAELIVLPELGVSGYSLGEIEDDLSLEVSDRRLAALVAEAGDAAVVVGFAEDGPGHHVYNSAAYFEGGAVCHMHRKLYLPTYGAFEERKHFSPGAAMRAFDTTAGRMAMLVCNDAWQPALAFLAVQDGAQVLIVPTSSATTSYPGALDTRSYWRDITRFYGRMFEAYVLFANRVGREGELEFWGGSHVVGPLGDVLAEAPEHIEDVLICDLDLGAVRRRRREVPLVREARLALVGREIDRLMQEGGDL